VSADRRTTIDVRIERLILDGVLADPRHARRVHAAVELELARLMTGTTPASFVGGAVPRVAAPQISLAAGDSPEVTGSRIAGAVHFAIDSRVTR
jgi:hypothetical protein